MVATLLVLGPVLAWFPEAALGALVFAWRKRESNRVFALSLQGGAIGVLLLVVFAAFKMYGMIPAGAAFALSIVLVAGLGVLAVLPASRTLAVLGLLAGFLAPIWLSTGSGNHVALFSYYAVLNAAIFGIAWAKSWRVLNLLGFVFTWGIGTLWGVLSYSPAKLASTQPFLVLFFAFYLLLPILYARRRPPSRRPRRSPQTPSPPPPSRRRSRTKRTRRRSRARRTRSRSRRRQCVVVAPVNRSHRTRSPAGTTSSSSSSPTTPTRTSFYGTTSRQSVTPFRRRCRRR